MSEVWIEMDVQPPEGFEPQLRDAGGWWFWADDYSDNSWLAPRPHKPGDVVKVPEEFCYLAVGYSSAGGGQFYVEIAYLHDAPSEREVTCAVSREEYLVAKAAFESDVDESDDEVWQPAETMPTWAIRERVITSEGTPVLRDGVWQWAFEFRGV